MTNQINAEIVSIGTEILLGEITDTNSVHIARVLRDIGLNLFYMTSVGDNEQRIADVIRLGLARSRVVITCGGLGPTIDDMTRQGVAMATGRGLTFHQTLLDTIAARFVGFGVQMTENNRRQAYLPDDAIVIENPVGTAPSFIVEHEGSVVISLPGVPREMKFLMAEKVVPYLREKFNLGSDIIKARVLRTAGIGESLLDSQIGADILEQVNPTVGLAAHAGQVDVRITAKAHSREEADTMIADLEAKLRERIGNFIFGVDDEQIEAVLCRLLVERSGTLAVSETGLVDVVSGRIRILKQDVQVMTQVWSYATPDDLKLELAVDEAMAIRTLAEKAAETACKTAGTTLAIAVVARPEMDEHHDDSESGTAIAVYADGKVRSRVYGFGGQSETAAIWSGTWAMSMAWRMLKEQAGAG